MRFIKLILLSLTCLASSCGGPDTRGWPHIVLDFNCSEISKITIDFTQHKFGFRDDQEKVDFLILKNPEQFESFVFYVTEFDLKKDPESFLDISNFRYRILVTFYYWKSDEIFTTNLRFYSYERYESKVMLNNGDVHFIPWEIGHLYEKFVAN